MTDQAGGVILAIMFLIYFVLELGWGGSWGDWLNYQRPRDVVPPRLKWRPPENDEPIVPAPQPRTPELVE